VLDCAIIDILLIIEHDSDVSPENEYVLCEIESAISMPLDN
jgi:hypothetical protein